MCGKEELLDLVRAYRQCAVRPSSKMFSHIVVQRPGTKEIAAFRMQALPFGAVRSVHSFLRFALSIWYLLVKEFMVLTANYFDDFVTLATSQESASVTSCVHMLLRLLGWAFAEGGPKAPDFHTLFQALGVQCNVSCMKDGLVLVGNTAGRREPGEETVFSGIGAVLFNPRGERVRFFSQRLDTEILKKPNTQGKKTAIYECEFFALFVRFWCGCHFSSIPLSYIQTTMQCVIH